MNNLHGFTDWLLFGIAIFFGILAVGLLLDFLRVMVSRTANTAFGRVFRNLLIIAVSAVLSGWLLFDHLNVF